MTTFDLGGNAGNSFQFDTIGDQVTGVIAGMEEVQQTDLQTGELKTFDNGQPMMMYRVDLQTQLRDPGNPTDDGKRSVYLKGSRKAESQSSLAAVLMAVQKATGTNNISTGGTLTLAYIGDGVAKNRGFNAPKLYGATYVAPTMSLGEQPVPVPQAAPAVAPVQQFAQQVAQQGPAPEWAVQQPAQAAPVAQPQQQVPVQLPAGLPPEILAAIQAAAAQQATA